MQKTENNVLKYLSLFSGIAAVAYIWFYDLYFEPNPAYGNRCSTASNVGRDHWTAFIIWGMILSLALIINVFYSTKKFNVPYKTPKVFALLSLIGSLGFVICKNEKFKRFVVNVSFDQYTGTQKSSYDQQTLVSSEPLLSFFWSKKSIHSASSIVFGVCLVAAILFIFIYKAKTSKKFRMLIVAFLIYVAATAVLLYKFLGGTAEVIAITFAIIPILIINHTNIMLDENSPDIPQKKEKETATR